MRTPDRVIVHGTMNDVRQPSSEASQKAVSTSHRGLVMQRGITPRHASRISLANHPICYVKPILCDFSFRASRVLLDRLL
jgi:hypothetical protein